MKKALFLIALCLLPLVARAETPEQINSFVSTITINLDGTIDVVEKIEYYFASEKHGIFRTIPYLKANEDGKDYAMTFERFAVTDLNGKFYDYQFSKTKNDITLKIGDPNATITGAHTYVISYRVKGALTYFEEHDELYWNVTGNNWPTPILDASTVINLPQAMPTTKLETYCYTGAQDSNLSDCAATLTNALTGAPIGNGATTETTTKVVSFKALRGLATGEGLTIAVGFPKTIVAVLEPELVKPSIWEILLGLLIKLALLGWYVVTPAFVTYSWFKEYLKGRSAKVVTAWFSPPKDTKFSPLSPAETSTLVDKSVDAKDLTATIIHLAQRGFLKIVTTKEKSFLSPAQFSLALTGKDTTELSKAEEYLITQLASQATNGQVSIKKLASSVRFGTTVEKFIEKVSQGLVTKKYFAENPQDKRNLMYGLSALSLFSFNLPLLISSLLFGLRSAKRTDLGIEKYGEAQSLKNFLKSQNEQLDFQAENQMFFEKLLPYATAFGVEDVWLKRFANFKFTKPDWYEGNTFDLAALHSIKSSLSHTASSSSAASRSSTGHSSGSSGGGFSGGGGGGGGGGSW